MKIKLLDIPVKPETFNASVDRVLAWRNALDVIAFEQVVGGRPDIGFSVLAAMFDDMLQTLALLAQKENKLSGHTGEVEHTTGLPEGWVKPQRAPALTLWKRKDTELPS